MLKLDNLAFHYRDAGEEHRYQFNLQADAGEIVGLTGRSGSGKSTCLDLIAGFLRPTSGAVLVNCEDITQLPPGRRPVTILFQRNNLFEHMTAAENVALGINTSLNLSAPQKDQVVTAINSVGLEKQSNQLSRTLSGGEQQRIALARSLVRGKPVLLLDEPFSALDATVRDEMLLLVRTIVTEKNLIALMVTHDISDCDKVADRHYILDGDKIEIAG